MTYEVIILGHLHMPLYFIGTFTEYSYLHQPLILTNLCRRITPTSFSEPINYAIGYQTGLTSIQLLE